MVRGTEEAQNALHAVVRFLCLSSRTELTERRGYGRGPASAVFAGIGTLAALAAMGHSRFDISLPFPSAENMPRFRDIL